MTFTNGLLPSTHSIISVLHDVAVCRLINKHTWWWWWWWWWWWGKSMSARTTYSPQSVVRPSTQHSFFT